jgi:hypothetical protein
MNDDLRLEARWGNRKESVDECANRGVELLHRLSPIDSAFARWYRMIGTRGPKDSLQHPVMESLDALRAEFTNYRNRRQDGSIIEDLGFGLRLWNGLDPGRIMVNVHAGAYPPNFPTFPNDSTIELPFDGSPAERLLRVDKLRVMMKAVVGSLDPDVAWVSSHAMWYAAYPENYRSERIVGWLTYFSRRYWPLPPLPKGYAVERVDDMGSLILIDGIDRLTASNPSHVEAVRRLSVILEQTGKRPVQK